MAILTIPDNHIIINNPLEIKQYLSDRGIWFDQWTAGEKFNPDATQDEIISAYAYVLKPFMEANGYKTSDVINIHKDSENLLAIRTKFLAEHTHSEDEVRFFVDGQGYFWFHLEDQDEPIFNVCCQAGDLISVPAGTKHWFDLGPEPFVKAIRVFIDQSGWIPDYTNSGLDQKYNPKYV